VGQVVVQTLRIDFTAIGQNDAGLAGEETMAEDPKKPLAQGPGLFYLEINDTVEDLPSQYTHIGTVGGMEFFSVPGGLEGGLLGNIFGGLF